MNNLNKSVDYASLENDLQKALLEEKLYKLQNDAKFRAVEQNVPTYEHFRQMVNAAHLKSLDKVDLRKKTNVSWNSSFITNNCNNNEPYHNLDQNYTPIKTKNVNTNVIPNTNEEFCQIWNKLHDSGDKIEFLYKIRDILQQKIFAAEISATFLSEFIEVFHASAVKENIHKIIELLFIISQCNRFYLNLIFLPKESKELCAHLFKKIMQVDMHDKPDIILLSEKYKIHTE